MEYESKGDTKCYRGAGKVKKKISKGTRKKSKSGDKKKIEIRGQEKNWNQGTNLDYSITKIDQNTEKSPRDLRRLVLTPI